ncbi:uncharacterized protein LOC112056331 isoform X2 [Bicyclus anynana]|nr:uncharacterized protein LOC112056331 isoform X2 [Bicyclus anynana]
MVHEEIIQQKLVIDYTHCTPLNSLYESCEYIFHKRGEDICPCRIYQNITDRLQGKLTVYSQIEMSNQQFLNSDNSSIKNFADLVSNSSKHCDPYTTTEPTSNETCEAIPDEIFRDNFKIATMPNRLDVAQFYKTNKWGPAGNNSVNGLRNGITILLNDTLDKMGKTSIRNGSFIFYISLYKNTNIWQRTFIISAQRTDVTTTHRLFVIDYVAIGLGLALLIGSIAVLALRKQLLRPLRASGAEKNNAAEVTEGEISSNIRKPSSLSTDKLLTTANTDITSIESEHNECDSEDDTKCNLTISDKINEV